MDIREKPLKVLGPFGDQADIDGGVRDLKFKSLKMNLQNSWGLNMQLQ